MDNQNSGTTSLPLSRYHEMSLDDKNEEEFALDPETYSDLVNSDDTVGDTVVSANHRLGVDEDYTSTEKYGINAQEMIVTTEADCTNYDNTTVIDSSKTNVNKSTDLSKDIVEGSPRFSLLR